MNEEKYTYTIDPPEEVVRKKQHNSRIKILSFILAGMIICSALGGTAGYFLANLPDTQSAQTQENTPPSASGLLTPVAASTAGQALNISQVFAQSNPAVVAISTQATSVNAFGQRATQAAAGSGFLISENGYVATNYHVISGATSITVMLHDGKEFKATLVGGDESEDLAVLKIEGTGFAYLSFGDSTELVVGEQVVAIGNPLGELANTLTVGYISALARSVNIDGNSMTMLQTDASISPGNSGGPLIDLYGHVIGIVSAKTSGNGVEGLGFAIPAKTAKSIIDDLIEHGYVTGRPYLGISVQDVGEDMARYYSMTAGLYVASVETGSCAEKAGLMVGDSIVALGGKEVSGFAEFKAQKMTFKAGDTTTITVLRDGKHLELTITFDEENTAPVATTPSLPDFFNRPGQSDDSTPEA